LIPWVSPSFLVVGSAILAENGFVKIDCHVHLLPFGGRFGGAVTPRGYRAIGGWILKRRLGLGAAATPGEQEARYVDDLAASVRGSELDRAVLLALDAVHDPAGRIRPDRTALYAPNDAAARTAALHPDAFLFGASVHPRRRDALDELDRVAALGAALVKLLPNSQGFDPADPALALYWRRLADLRLPLLVHCGYEHTLPAIDQAWGDPRRLEPALGAGVTVIVAHAGSAGMFHGKETFGDFLRLLERHPRCFGDTSALANFWRSKYLFALLDPARLEREHGVRLEAPLSRFVHGSDYPVPVTAFAFAGRGERAARRRARAVANELQKDIELKRLAGVPDAVLGRAASILRIGNETP
jgi:predicted TIM-barrel fold metal-dependent hydrolase